MAPKRTCNCMLAACQKCRGREYARKVHRAKAYGEWEPKGDVAQVRAHLELLRANRVGVNRIGQLTGMSRSTIFRVRSGQNKWITKSVADAILAVQPDATVRVSPVGTSRRIRALMALGWSTYYMADTLGTPQARVWELSKARQWVTPETHANVAALYDELCMTVGPSTVTRSRARVAGHLPPLAWNDIDDPDEKPSGVFTGTLAQRQGPARASVDHARVERIVVHRDFTLAGEATQGERAAVLARWPGTLNELERLTGWRVDRYHLPNGAA